MALSDMYQPATPQGVSNPGMVNFDGRQLPTLTPAQYAQLNASNITPGQNYMSPQDVGGGSLPGWAQGMGWNNNFTQSGSPDSGFTYQSGGGGNLNVVNPGGGSTNYGYTLDPTSGNYVPSSAQGVGQGSWWQNQGIGDVMMLGAGAAGTIADSMAAGTNAAAGAGASTPWESGFTAGPSVATGAPQMAAGTNAAAGAAASTPWESGFTAGPSVATASSSPSLGQILNGVKTVGDNLNSMVGSGSPLGNLFNTYSGNKANQNISNNLMNMYTGALNTQGPSVNAMNQMIQDPNSFFQSPLYQSQAALYGNGVNAAKNAAGTNGNSIDYTQKMMGFAGQQYNNTLASYTNAANATMANTGRYGQDYAYGTALGNTSNAAANGTMLGNIGSVIGGLGSLFSNGSNIASTIGKWF
jgi:hypothetical protein